MPLFKGVAVRAGFEPAERVSPFAGLANRWFQPLTHLTYRRFRNTFFAKRDKGNSPIYSMQAFFKNYYEKTARKVPAVFQFLHYQAGILFFIKTHLDFLFQFANRFFKDHVCV